MSGIVGTVISGMVSLGFTAAQKSIASSSSKPGEFEPEGLVNLVELGLLSQTQIHKIGTLIGFNQHSIELHDKNPLQWAVRAGWTGGHPASHEDLPSLEDHLKLIMRRVWVSTNTPEQKADIKTIAEFAIKGIEALKASYSIKYQNDAEMKTRIERYLNKGIEALQKAMNSEVEECPQIALDIEVRKNYEKSADYRSVAQRIANLSKPGNSLELNKLYVTELSSWAKSKIEEFKAIKVQVLKRGNLYSS